MNPWIILTVAVLWATSLAGGYYKGYENGGNALIAKQKREDDIRRETLEWAQQGAAEEIAKIEIKNTTINRKVEYEVRTQAVYRDCRHTPDGMRAVTEAFTGFSDATPAGVVPGGSPAGGRQFRDDKPKTR